MGPLRERPSDYTVENIDDPLTWKTVTVLLVGQIGFYLGKIFEFIKEIMDT